MYKLKKIFILGVFVLISFFNIWSVYADEIIIVPEKIKVTYASNNKTVCFSGSTGAYTQSFTWAGASSVPSSGCSYYTRMMYISDGAESDDESVKAYCMDWGRQFRNGDSYVRDDAWASNSKKAVVTGMLVTAVANDIKSGTDYLSKRYAMIGAVINSYMREKLGLAGQFNFYGKNTDVTNYIDTTLDRYDKYIADYIKDKSVTKPTFASSDKYMTATKIVDTTANSYVSKKITLNAVETFGYSTVGAGDSKNGVNKDSVNYTLTTEIIDGPANVNATICTSLNSSGEGTKCSSEISYKDLPGTTGDRYFYVKLAGSGLANVNNNTKVRVKINGTNSSKYWTSGRYIDTAANDTQRLITRDKLTVERTTSARWTLSVVVPVEEPEKEPYVVTLTKYDADTNSELEGATLRICSVSIGDSSQKHCVSNTNGASMFSISGYKSDYNSNFSIIGYEDKAPDGYILGKKEFTLISNFSVDDIFGLISSETCYNVTTGKTETDIEYCNFSSYQNMCKNASGDFSELSNGVCSDDTEKVCAKVNTDGTYTDSDSKYCDNKSDYMLFSNTSGRYEYSITNKKNVVRISKMEATGEKEVSGAQLKVCTKESYDSKKANCDVAKTVDNVSMKWTSGSSAKEFAGLVAGTYYILEVIPPNGYIQLTTATEFTISEDGSVRTGGKTITNDDFVTKDASIIINNQLNTLTISKQDIATSKELPGATLSVCMSYKDADGKYQILKDEFTGNCIAAETYNGENLTWKSTSTPKSIKGLPAGKYYLVEEIAPTDYSNAEAIFFEMRNDGKIYDASGKLISDNKITMYDKKIEEVKTGQSSLYVVVGILLVVGGLGAGAYYYMTHKNLVSTARTTGKIRKRKIHKKS